MSLLCNFVYKNCFDSNLQILTRLCSYLPDFCPIIQSPGEGDGSPLQYSCLENPIDKGAWQAKAHGVAKSWMWLSDWRTSPAPHGRHVAWWVFVWFAFCFGRHPVTCGILVPRPRMEPVPPALGVWSLNYKEIPLLGVLRFIVSVSLWVTA